jgi:ssDNA-binding Zn-finger/Zn-ribbon topoisomerase 1
MRKLKKQLPSPPVRPMCRIIEEGTTGSCPKCHSTERRRFGIFGGKKLGCINPECENYYKK